MAQRWIDRRAGWPRRSGSRCSGPFGVHNIRTYTDPNNPVHVSLTADVDDMDAFGAFIQSEAAAEAMASDGVLPETVVVLIEA
jgi:hypothetical protein